MKPSSESLFISHLVDRIRRSKVGRINHPRYNLVDNRVPFKHLVKQLFRTMTRQHLGSNTNRSTCQHLNSAPSQPVSLSVNRRLLQHVKVPTSHSHPHHDCCVRKPDICSRSSRLFRCRFPLSLQTPG